MRKNRNTGRGKTRQEDSKTTRGGNLKGKRAVHKSKDSSKGDRKTTGSGARKTSSTGDRSKSGNGGSGYKPSFSSKGRRPHTPGTVKSKSPMPSMSDDVRLNKYIANAGVSSRREADELIANGLVEVNNVVVEQMGYKVKPGDVVKYAGEVITAETKMYVLLNKPKDYITTMDDPDGRKTVMSLVHSACKERVFPVGRLDRNTTGLLLFTNDGDLAKKLTHPSYKAKKIYHVTTDTNVRLTDIEKLTEGVSLDDGIIKCDDVAYVTPTDRKQVGVEIHSGKYRVVRRMFESMEYKVKKLDRVSFSGLTKKDLPRGKWRFLTEKEVSFLKMSK